MSLPTASESAVLPFVTFLISTFNRKAVLLRTLAELREIDRRCGLVTQTVVVDNASRDGTADAVRRQFPQVVLVPLNTNQGACAKNHGLPLAAGEFVFFLDDDSFPTAGGIREMIGVFQRDPRLGAIVFDVTLPNGTHECSAYPNVVIGCGTAFRKSALLEAGGLPTDFFMQAEEYDLSLRLLDRGWKIERFDDLKVRHLKTSAARIPTRTTRLDVRNNLMLATRYFPRPWIVPMAMDWTRRYFWLARGKGPGHTLAAVMGAAQGVARSLRPGHRRPMGLAAFEQFAMVVTIRRQLEQAVRQRRLRTVVLADVGKNILPFYQAACACQLRVLAIADDRLARPGRTYHGIEIITDAQARNLNFDAVVISNVSPVHARQRAAQWRLWQSKPVLNLLEPQPVQRPKLTAPVAPRRKAA